MWGGKRMDINKHDPPYRDDHDYCMSDVSILWQWIMPLAKCRRSGILRYKRILIMVQKKSIILSLLWRKHLPKCSSLITCFYVRQFVYLFFSVCLNSAGKNYHQSNGLCTNIARFGTSMIRWLYLVLLSHHSIFVLVEKNFAGIISICQNSNDIFFTLLAIWVLGFALLDKGYRLM